MKDWKAKLLTFYLYSVPIAAMYFFIVDWDKTAGIIYNFTIHLVLASVNAFIWPLYFLFS